MARKQCFLVFHLQETWLGNNVSWFFHLQETWLQNNVSWFFDLLETWLGIKQYFQVCLYAQKTSTPNDLSCMACPLSGNIARKQCFLVCRPLGNMTGNDKI